MKLDGVPAEILSYPEMRDLVLLPLRADLRLDETYVYSPEGPLDCPILACGGRNDPEVPLHTMQQWQICTRAKFVYRVFEGGHFFMQTSAALFAMEITSFLRSVVGAGT